MTAEEPHEGFRVGDVIAILVVLGNGDHEIAPITGTPTLEFLLFLDFSLAQGLKGDLMDAQL